MTRYDCWNPQPDTRILFKDMILDNIEDIKSYMNWENYELNDTMLTVTETVKDHALIVLMNSYGLFHVEQDEIFESFCADVFIYFPILLQQLAITRLIDAFGVVRNDTNIVETVREETANTNTEQNSEITQGTSQTDNNVVDLQQNSSINIENNSGVESTGTRNVNLNHNMPEQGLAGGTGNFPLDTQGTPILTATFATNATEGFSTSKPITTNETSEQTNENTNTGTTTRTMTNSGSDNTEATIETTGNNTSNETITSTLTNKQYAYEIKAFLETADGLIAFSKWEDKFTWVVGII